MGRAAIKQDIYARAERRLLGNTKNRLKQLAFDLLSQCHPSDDKKIAESSCLSRQTIRRFMELDPDYRPSCDTVERVLIYFNIELEAKQVQIRKAYQNKPKEY